MKTIFAISLIFYTIFISLPVYSNSYSHAANIYQLDFSDPALARKVAISFHHAVLETNYKEGYMILDLSDSDVKKLAEFNLKPKKSAKWQQKFDTQMSNLKQQLTKSKNSTGIPGYECYATVEETLSDGEQLSIDYPNLVEWIDIGDSWNKVNASNGYDLMVLKITNQNIVQDKPKLFIHSAMHARELTTAALTLDFAKLLLNNYTTNADYQWVIDYHEVHILFHMNPDGRKIAETGALHRKNTNQNHCPGDDVGVDLNRNFAYFWNTTTNGSSSNECDADFRGASAESEPETQAVSNYIRSLFPDSRGDNENDAAPLDTQGIHLDIHSFSELVLWPYGHTDEPSPNDDGFVALGNKLAYFNDYTPQQSVGLYPTDGTSDDVSYGELGIAAFTFELGTSFFQACSVYENAVKPDNLPALFYSAKAAAAPYLLAHGPEITQMQLNQSQGEVSVETGSEVNLSITADTSLTQQTTNGRVNRIEYTIDQPIWEDSATPIALTSADGSIDSAQETFNGTLETSELTIGQHILYFRAYNQDNQVGVPSAVFLNITEAGAPVAVFDVNCDQLVCNFDASASQDSDGSITDYSWDLGNGVSLSGETVSYTYNSPGDKQILLTITDNDNNQSTTSQIVTLTANQAPLAEFFVNCQALTCQFNASSSQDPDGSINQYEWRFGDNSNAQSVTSSSTSYTYNSAGSYQVTLTITDNQDATDSLTKTATATSPEDSSSSSGGGTIGYWVLIYLALIRIGTKNRVKPLA